MAEPANWTVVGTMALAQIQSASSFTGFTNNSLAAPASGNTAAILLSGSGIEQEIHGFTLGIGTGLTVTAAIGVPLTEHTLPTVSMSLIVVETGNVLVSLNHTVLTIGAFDQVALSFVLTLSQSSLIGDHVMVKFFLPSDQNLAAVDNVQVEVITSLPTTVATTTTSTAASTTTSTPSAFNESVVVLNPSFEADVLTGSTVQFLNSATGWAIKGSAGTYLPPTSAFSRNADGTLASPAAGLQCAFLKPGSMISQLLPRPLIANDIYYVTFAVGARADGSYVLPNSISADLRLGVTLLTTVNFNLSTTIVPLGNFTAFTFTYTVPSSAAYLGQLPTIQFLATGGVATAQAALDNIKVSVQTTTSLSTVLKSKLMTFSDTPISY